ncbi:hypothetical protein VNO77_26986 [Canavalia gladiata]|uniref:Uncharacterized protein n=1 Tax=Canavalia gladiata TaxID=3824 RepID=A0AAN9Q6R4_CANGL
MVLVERLGAKSVNDLDLLMCVRIKHYPYIKMGGFTVNDQYRLTTEFCIRTSGTDSTPRSLCSLGIGQSPKVMKNWLSGIKTGMSKVFVSVWHEPSESEFVGTKIISRGRIGKDFWCNGPNGNPKVHAGYEGVTGNSVHTTLFLQC